MDVCEEPYLATVGFWTGHGEVYLVWRHDGWVPIRSFHLHHIHGPTMTSA